MSNSQYVKEYREWLKSKGYCINCGKEEVWKDRVLCPICLDKNKESSERTRTETSKEQRRKYIKRKRELCIAFGICRECLKRTAKVGLKCIECYSKGRQRNERKRKTVSRILRVELGLCYFCGEQSLKGKKTCKKHFELQSNKLKEWHLKNPNNNENHIWRKIQNREIERIKHNSVRYENRKIELTEKYKINS